jgi:hypothetical protein
VKVVNFTKIIQGICTVKVPLQRAASMLFYVNKGPTSVDSNDLSGINGDENSTNSDERSLRLRFSDNDGDKNNIDSQKCNRHHYILIQTNSHLTYKVMVEQRQQNYLPQEIIIQEKTTLQVQMMKKVYFCLQ